MKQFILFFSILFAISSCTISIDLTIQPDDSGTYAIGVHYSDSIRTIMGDMSQTNDKLEGEIMSDEMKEKYPESMELPEFVETDSSASLVFKFKNLEELNEVFNAMQEGPKAEQSMLKKGKKYLFHFQNSSESKEEREDEGDVLNEENFLKEINFQYTLTFPERSIVKVKKIEDYKISSNQSKITYKIPLSEIEEKKQIDIQVKVK